MAVKEKEIQVFQCRCERCGWTWKTESMPVRCAKCKSPYWNIKPNNNK